MRQVTQFRLSRLPKQYERVQVVVAQYSLRWVGVPIPLFPPDLNPKIETLHITGRSGVVNFLYCTSSLRLLLVVAEKPGFSVFGVLFDCYSMDST